MFIEFQRQQAAKCLQQVLLSFTRALGAGHAPGSLSSKGGKRACRPAFPWNSGRKETENVGCWVEKGARKTPQAHLRQLLLCFPGAGSESLFADLSFREHGDVCV